MRELKIEQDARAIVEAHGCELVKMKLVGTSSWPDRALLVPRQVSKTGAAKICFVEFKKPGEAPTPAQNDTIKGLRDKGFEAFWTDNTMRVLQWLAVNVSVFPSAKR